MHNENWFDIECNCTNTSDDRAIECWAKGALSTESTKESNKQKKKQQQQQNDDGIEKPASDLCSWKVIWVDAPITHLLFCKSQYCKYQSAKKAAKRNRKRRKKGKI